MCGSHQRILQWRRLSLLLGTVVPSKTLGAGLGCGTSQVMNQSHMVTSNHVHDSTVPIPAVQSDNQCGALLKDDDQCWQIAAAILTAQ